MMADSCPSNAVDVASELAAPLDFVPKEKERCSGQPKVIKGSNWLQESGRPTGHKGYNRSGGYRDYRHYNHFQKQQGLVGERYVLERMLAILDGCWVIYTNLELFVKAGDIDIALVGPGGVFALEIKALSRDLYVVYDDWLIFEDKVPQSYGGQPSYQAKENAFKLEIYLESYGLSSVFVWPIVIMASNALIQVHESKIPVWCKKDLDNELSKLNTYEVYSPEALTQIVEILAC